MRQVTCSGCGGSFDESQNQWDRLHRTGRCPRCGRPIGDRRPQLSSEPERAAASASGDSRPQLPTEPERAAARASGLGGQIEVFSDRVRLRRSGAFAKLAHGLKGDKDILIASISSIQFKKASVLVTGYIQFTFGGGGEAKRGILQGIRDENTVMFRNNEQGDFVRVRDLIQRRMAALHGPVAESRSPSFLDELAKLAGLRDKGIVTEEEFEAKKKQLLGM